MLKRPTGDPEDGSAAGYLLEIRKYLFPCPTPPHLFLCPENALGTSLQHGENALAIFFQYVERFTHCINGIELEKTRKIGLDTLVHPEPGLQ